MLLGSTLYYTTVSLPSGTTDYKSVRLPSHDGGQRVQLLRLPAVEADQERIGGGDAEISNAIS